MADYFADTIALAKRYISEAGSAWVGGLLDPAVGAQTFIVRVAAVEIIAAVTRRERAGSPSSADATVACTAFERDLDSEYQAVEVTAALVRRAMRLAAVHGMRGCDAIHLAAAIEVNEALVASASAPRSSSTGCFRIRSRWDGKRSQILARYPVITEARA